MERAFSFIHSATCINRIILFQCQNGKPDEWKNEKVRERDGEGKAIRVRPQLAQDHLPKNITLMFSHFATTSNSGKLLCKVYLIIRCGFLFLFSTTSNFTPINGIVPYPILQHFHIILFYYLWSLSSQNTSSLSGLTYICYSVAALTQLFLYCFGGNHVGESVSKTARTFPLFPLFPHLPRFFSQPLFHFLFTCTKPFSFPSFIGFRIP